MISPRLLPLLVLLLVSPCMGELQTYRSERYVIHTDLPRAEAAEYARHMDATFDAFARRFDGLGEPIDHRLALYLFRDAGRYAAFLSGKEIDSTNSGGMFFVRGDKQGLAIWVGDRPRAELFSTLQHEGFHQFAWNRVGDRLPIWLNEGLAQYFEDALLIDGDLRTGMREPENIERVREALQTGNALPLDRLTRLTGDDWARTLTSDPDRAALLYAQSWSLAYFLIHGREGRYRSRLDDYLAKLAAGRPHDAALRAAFGTDGLGEAQDPWEAYARQQQPDPLNIAKWRLEFLAAALAFLDERDEAMPTSMRELRADLQRRKFTLTRTSRGLTQKLEATNDELFRYPLRDRGDRGNQGSRGFELLEPSRAGLPPRVVAAGLDPKPTLVWSRDERGALVSAVEFR